MACILSVVDKEMIAPSLRIGSKADPGAAA